jgi:hypothetical protein
MRLPGMLAFVKMLLLVLLLLQLLVALGSFGVYRTFVTVHGDHLRTNRTELLCVPVGEVAWVRVV